MSEDKQPQVPFFVDLEEDEDDDEDVFSSVSIGGASASMMPLSAPPSVSGAFPAVSVTGAMPAVSVPSGGIVGMSSTGVNPAGISGSFSSVKVKLPDQMRARIALLSPDHQILRELDVQGSRFLIGGPGSDLILDDPFVARWHAQLYIAPSGALTLEELDETNGVFLRIADEFMLEDNDEFLMGYQRFIFRQRSESPKLYGDAPTSRTAPKVRHLGGPAPKAFPHLIHVIEDGHIAGLYPMPDMLNIGQSRGEITCPSDPCMAAYHAFIERRHDKYYLHDAGSDFGTYVRVHGAIELLQGDCFILGRTRITVLRVG